MTNSAIHTSGVGAKRRSNGVSFIERQSPQTRVDSSSSNVILTSLVTEFIIVVCGANIAP